MPVDTWQHGTSASTSSERRLCHKHDHQTQSHPSVLAHSRHGSEKRRGQVARVSGVTAILTSLQVHDLPSYRLDFRHRPSMNFTKYLAVWSQVTVLLPIRMFFFHVL